MPNSSHAVMRYFMEAAFRVAQGGVPLESMSAMPRGDSPMMAAHGRPGPPGVPGPDPGRFALAGGGTLDQRGDRERRLPAARGGGRAARAHERVGRPPRGSRRAPARPL